MKEQNTGPIDYTRCNCALSTYILLLRITLYSFAKSEMLNAITNNRLLMCCGQFL